MLSSRLPSQATVAFFEVQLQNTMALNALPAGQPIVQQCMMQLGCGSFVVAG
jgi:hypothetical protein